LVVVGVGGWSDVGSAVLRDLLLVLWSDALDHFDTGKALVHIGDLFGAERRAWTRQVEARWATFRTEVQRAWVLQLLAAEIVHGDHATPTDPDELPAPLPSRPVAATVEDRTRHDEAGYGAEWSGFSLNVWWRRHFGMVPPDPPLLLELDAIGDDAPGAVRVQLDHDDAARSRIFIPGTA
jgi:hypothetical protein